MGLGEEGHRGTVPFSSPHVGGSHSHRDLSLLMLTLVIAEVCVSGQGSPLQSHPSPHIHTGLSGRKPLHSQLLGKGKGPEHQNCFPWPNPWRRGDVSSHRPALSPPLGVCEAPPALPASLPLPPQSSARCSFSFRPLLVHMSLPLGIQVKSWGKP